MYMQTAIAAAAAPSFHFKDPVIDPATRLADLEAVIALANAGRGRMKRLGKFSVALARNDDDDRYFTQIRALPVTGFGGCEFRFNMPARCAGDRDLESIARQLLSSARAFASLTGVAKFTDLALKSAGSLIESTQGGTAMMRLIAFGMTVEPSSKHVDLILDVETLGDDLQPGVDRIHARDIVKLEESLRKIIENHARRQALRDLAKASRALGWIDDTALVILDASGLARQQAFSILRNKRECEFYFGGADGFDNAAALFWDDGTIFGSFHLSDNVSSFCGQHLTLLKPQIPETILTAWPGHRFGAVISHPYISDDAVVTEVTSNEKWLYVQMVAGTRLVDEDAGQVRADTRV